MTTRFSRRYGEPAAAACLASPWRDAPPRGSHRLPVCLVLVPALCWRGREKTQLPPEPRPFVRNAALSLDPFWSQHRTAPGPSPTVYWNSGYEELSPALEAKVSAPLAGPRTYKILALDGGGVRGGGGAAVGAAPLETDCSCCRRRCGAC